MEKPTSSRNEAIIYAVSGLLSCLAVGYLFNERRVFNPIDPAYQFFVCGVTGAILASVLKFSTNRNFLYSTVFLLLLYVVWARISHAGPILARLLQFAGIAAAIYVYQHFFEAALPELRFGKFLSLGGAIAVMHLFLSALAIIFIELPEPRLEIEHHTFGGFLIGIGLGIGFEIAELVEVKLFRVHPVS